MHELPSGQIFDLGWQLVLHRLPLGDSLRTSRGHLIVLLRTLCSRPVFARRLRLFELSGWPLLDCGRELCVCNLPCRDRVGLGGSHLVEHMHRVRGGSELSRGRLELHELPERVLRNCGVEQLRRDACVGLSGLRDGLGGRGPVLDAGRDAHGRADVLGDGHHVRRGG